MASSLKPTEVSAFARLRRILGDRVASGIRREVHEGKDLSVSSIVATVGPASEQLESLSPEELVAVQENAQLATQFLETFGSVIGGPIKGNWTLEDLDRSFQVWLEATDKHGFTDAAVTAILGAAYGGYCVKHLSMHWLKVVDSHGISYAVRADSCDVRTYPLDVVAKRVSDREHGFFAAVFVVLKNSIASAQHEKRDA